VLGGGGSVGIQLRPRRWQKFQANISKQKREKLSKDKSVCFNKSRFESSFATSELKNRKKRKRGDFEGSGSI